MKITEALVPPQLMIHDTLTLDKLRRMQSLIKERTNPCAEIPVFDYRSMYPKPTEFLKEYKAEFMNSTDGPNTTPHSQRGTLYGTNVVNVGGADLNGKLTIRDEDMTLKVNMPGVPRERLEIRRIDNLLRIRVRPDLREQSQEDIFNQREPRVAELVLFMTAEETVENVALDLGVLTVNLNRGREVEDFDIG